MCVVGVVVCVVCVGVGGAVVVVFLVVGAQCCSRGPKGAQDKLRLAQYGSGGLKGAQDGSERGGGAQGDSIGLKWLR